MIPPTCVPSNQWSCETITESGIWDLARKHDVSIEWIYKYNTEYLSNTTVS